MLTPEEELAAIDKELEGTPKYIDGFDGDGIEHTHYYTRAERIELLRTRLEAAEKLAAYGERQLRKEYDAEAGVEKLMADVIYHVPSDHRTFEAFVDERLAALAGEKKP
jgi:hypothetical protein